jgi:hypothetical protein
MLGGTTNFEADRQASHAAATLVPGGHEANRDFRGRAVRHLAGEATQETFVLRTHDEVARSFDGLELLDPGVVLVDESR